MIRSIEEITSIHVGFWLIDGNEDMDTIFSCYVTTYPPYKKGDVIWLEQSVMPNTLYGKDGTPMELTKYTITDVQYSIKRYINDDIMTVVSMEVRIRPAEDAKRFIL